MSVKTRIAPSPTGHLHIGTVRTALFNYLFAHHEKGTYAVRIEDTDRARSLPEFEEEIREGLVWLGLEEDEFVRQSERLSRHTELLGKLIEEGKAYISKEDSRSEPGKTVEVVRLRNEPRDVTFRDEVRGDITFHSGELEDFVIARAIDDPLYHFAVVVDDADMAITHVIRGEDHISNTTRQILIQEALGVARPLYAHLPLILAPDRSKLSKRHGATSLMEYRDEGFMPEAIVNYLALLGWNPGDDREDFSLPELVKHFSLDHIQKSGAVWDREKLLSVNQRWMRKLSDSEFISHVPKEAAVAATMDSGVLLRAIPLLKDRCHTFKEAGEMLLGELACLFAKPILNVSQLTAKGSPETTQQYLGDIRASLHELAVGLTVEEIKAALMPYADAIPKEEGGRGAVLWPLRYALSGLERSPDPFSLIYVLGIEESVSRLSSALAIL